MTYKFNSFVNNSEASALKDMIFNRVRERSQSITEDVQSDVMDMARQSFASNNNPFANIIASNAVNNDKSTDSFESTINEIKNEKIETKPQQEKTDIGFPQRELKARAVEQERMVQAQLASSAIMDTMDEAREGLTNKKSFMGALNFLNSQAAVSLMRTRADKFEIVV